MGVQNCNGCRSWEDDIYWSHFQFLHFMQFLRAEYDQHLALPKTFSDNLRKKLPENVTLKGPSGVAWKVAMIARGDTLYLAHGWGQFVKDHYLKENDFLVFKYNGESQFDVLVFDGGNLCEKACSYFVRKCGHTEGEHVGGSLNRRRDTTEGCVEEGHTPSNAGVKCASPERSVHANGSKEPINVPFETPTRSEEALNADVESGGAEQVRSVGIPLSAVPTETANGKRIRKLVSAVKHVQTKRRGRPAKVSHVMERAKVIDRAIDWVSGVESGEPVSAVKSGSYELFISNRRPVTEDEIKNAFALAQAERTEDGLVIVMRPSHSMPNKWIGEHISPMSQDVILRMGKGEWIARYSYHNIRHTGGFTGGWKHFVLDNNLEEYDVCVFKPAGQMNETMVIDMAIFRVVQETVPLSVMSPSGKRARKSAQNANLTET
ncbi:hypothetical protein ACSQ67_000163 [Phaseolus vulgaris]